jgi:hypothetical protein
MNTIVPPGVSGQQIYFDATSVDPAMVASELALMQLGDFIPLDIKIDTNRFKQEIQAFQNEWVDYLPRTDRANNRKSLVLSQLPGKSYKENPSFAQACYEAGRRLSENDFNEKTTVYTQCRSLHCVLDEFQPLGRSFLVQCNVGGYFIPHRDHPELPRESFRLIAFLNNCNPLEYDWIMDTDTKLQIEHGRVYYVNTRKVHRTISWVNNSIHMIMNVPFTAQNVAKVLNHLQHRH